MSMTLKVCMIKSKLFCSKHIMCLIPFLNIAGRVIPNEDLDGEDMELDLPRKDYKFCHWIILRLWSSLMLQISSLRWNFAVCFNMCSYLLPTSGAK